MAVYTEVSDAALTAFFAEYDLGVVLSCKGIAEGVENSNYLVVTEAGPHILTLYEKRVAPQDLPFFLGLMEHLADKGLPCPLPVHDRNGDALKTLCDRSAAVTTFLQGMWPRQVTTAHCAALGEIMAQMHAAAADFPGERENTMGQPYWRSLFESSAEHAGEVATGLGRLIHAELEALEEEWPQDLPAGIIHADLFPDNVFFQEGKLSGVIDFYFACSDFLALDLAIAVNAWCFDSEGAFEADKCRALIAGYQKWRQLTPREREAFQILCRGAALRFLLTRLHDWLHTPSDALVRRKDPLDYRARLMAHRVMAGPEEYGL